MIHYFSAGWQAFVQLEFYYEKGPDRVDRPLKVKDYETLTCHNCEKMPADHHLLVVSFEHQNKGNRVNFSLNESAVASAGDHSTTPSRNTNPFLCPLPLPGLALPLRRDAGKVGMDGGDYWALSHSAGVWVILLPSPPCSPPPHPPHTHTRARTHTQYHKAQHNRDIALTTEAAYLHRISTVCRWEQVKISCSPVEFRCSDESCQCVMLHLGTCPAHAWSQRSCTKILSYILMA